MKFNSEQLLFTQFFNKIGNIGSVQSGSEPTFLFHYNINLSSPIAPLGWGGGQTCAPTTDIHYIYLGTKLAIERVQKSCDKRLHTCPPIRRQKNIALMDVSWYKIHFSVFFCEIRLISKNFFDKSC